MNFSEWFREHLQVGAVGFVWSAEQVPEARRYANRLKDSVNGQWPGMFFICCTMSKQLHCPVCNNGWVASSQ